MSDIVLLVDDEIEVVNALKRTLHREDYQILTAGSADQALGILEGVKVSVLVSDHQMPGRTGLELLKQMRDRFSDVISIMLTGKADLDLAIQAINAGQIYRFFQKPCNEIDLALTIREAIQQRQLVMQTRKMLDVIRMQSKYLDQLEKEVPGISVVRRDSKGAIILDDRVYDVDEIMRETEDALGRVHKSLTGCPGKE